MQAKMSYTKIGIFSLASYPYRQDALPSCPTGGAAWRMGSCGMLLAAMALALYPSSRTAEHRHRLRPPFAVPASLPHLPACLPASLASLPARCSFKLLWSPIVDSLYWPAVGRRRSWILPLQTASAALMLLCGGWVEAQLDAGNAAGVTSLFFLLVLLAATQDVAVDGWALTLLSKQHVGCAPPGSPLPLPEQLAHAPAALTPPFMPAPLPHLPPCSYAATCQTVGMNIGYFASFTVFLALNDPSFSNKWLPAASAPGQGAAPPGQGWAASQAAWPGHFWRPRGAAGEPGRFVGRGVWRPRLPAALSAPLQAPCRCLATCGSGAGLTWQSPRQWRCSLGSAVPGAGPGQAAAPTAACMAAARPTVSGRAGGLGRPSHAAARRVCSVVLCAARAGHAARRRLARLCSA